MLKIEANPEGLPIEAFDTIRAGADGDRAQYYWEPANPFYGFNRPGASGSDGVRRAFWLWSMQVGLKGAHDCIAQFSGQDFTEHLKRIDVPPPPATTTWTPPPKPALFFLITARDSAHLADNAAAIRLRLYR